MSRRDTSMPRGSDAARERVERCGSRRRLRRRARRGRIWPFLLLLPVAIPAALLVGSVLLFVARTLLKVVFEVAEGLFGGSRWVLWGLLLLFLPRLLRRWRHGSSASEALSDLPPPSAAGERPISPLLQLVLETRRWLGEQLSELPPDLTPRIHGMQTQLSALAGQLREREPDAHVGAELRSVLRDDLPELVNAYRKVPSALQQRPGHGGSSPEEQLRAGLATLDGQLHALHARLAAEDLQKLAVHQRYLELKYNPPGGATS